MKLYIKKMSKNYALFNDYTKEKIGHIKYKNDKVFFRPLEKEWYTTKEIIYIQKLMWQLYRNIKEGYETELVRHIDPDLTDFIKEMIPRSTFTKRSHSEDPRTTESK